MKKVPPRELPEEIACRQESDELRMWTEAIVNLAVEQQQQLETQQQQIAWLQD